MKQKIAVLVALIFLFAIGFWSSGWIISSAQNYEAGSKRNPLASKSYLEETVEDKLDQMETEIQDLTDRVDTLLQILQK